VRRFDKELMDLIQDKLEEWAQDNNKVDLKELYVGI
jgi:hypothetical protein